MILDCFGGSSQLYDFEEYSFLYVFGILIIAAVPAAIGSVLWRMFVTNRKGPAGTTILGLDENSATYREVYDHGMSWQTTFLYGLTGVVFGLETFVSLVDLFLG